MVKMMKCSWSVSLALGCLLGLMSCSFSGSQDQHFLAQIDSIGIENVLSSASLERSSTINRGNLRDYYVAKAEGIYAYTKPSTNADKVHVYYTGENIFAEPLGNGWARISLSLRTEGHRDEEIVAYVQLSDLTTDANAISLTNEHLNAIWDTSPWGLSGSYLDVVRYTDSLVHIELVDEQTYKEAQARKVDHFLPDLPKKRGGQTVLPIDTINLELHRDSEGSKYWSDLRVRDGKLVLVDRYDARSGSEAISEYSYLGRLSHDGAYVIYWTDNHWERSYDLITPKGHRIVEGSMHPYNLSPKGDYVISLGTSIRQGSWTTLDVLKVEGEQEYEPCVENLYAFWVVSYDEGSKAESLFWSEDDCLYMKVKPMWSEKTYYARVEIQGKSMLQKAKHFISNLLPIS